MNRTYKSDTFTFFLNKKIIILPSFSARRIYSKNTKLSTKEHKFSYIHASLCTHTRTHRVAGEQGLKAKDTQRCTTEIQADGQIAWTKQETHESIKELLHI